MKRQSLQQTARILLSDVFSMLKKTDLNVTKFSQVQSKKKNSIRSEKPGVGRRVANVKPKLNPTIYW